MKYETQKVALPFFAVAMALFALQIVFGTLAATVYVMPDFLSEAMPFHIMRMSHTNLLLVWLLIGFFGCAYFLLPEEAETEIYSPKLAYLQLAIFAGAGAAALIGYQFEIHGGRHYLEQPVYVKVLLTISFLMFLFNGTMTVIKGAPHLGFRCLASRPMACCHLLAFRLLRAGQPGPRQALGGGGSSTSGVEGVWGADHGLHPRLPADQDGPGWTGKSSRNGSM
jgi:Nitric oxide reductase large subunit